LRMAATQRRTTHRDSVLMLDQCDPVFHGPRLVSWQRRIKPVRERKYPHHRTRLRPRRRNPDPGAHAQRPRQPSQRPHHGSDCPDVANRPAPPAGATA
jgi:hypothetical protein